MKWSDAEAGQDLRIKGETWQVVARDGDKITMRHATLGEKSGSPPPDGEVELAPPPKGSWDPRAGKSEEQLERYERALKSASARGERDVELEKMQAYAKAQGFKHVNVSKMGKSELREAIQNLHAKRVAEDNGVPERKVQDVTLRLILGATLIAELHEGSEVAQAPKVEVMDGQTFRHHLHFMHGTYPAESVQVDELVRLHEDSHDADREAVLHEHSVPF